MPTQYGELKNGLRAYITYTLTTTATTYTLTITNAGLMAPAPIANNISLPAGNYTLSVHPRPQDTYISEETLYRSAHTFTKGNTDRWQQVFTADTLVQKSYSGTLNKTAYSGGNTSVGVSIRIRRDTSPVYQTLASIPIPTKAKYTVSYNANGGAGAPASQTKWYGEDINLQAGKPTRTGYTFKNWNTKQNGTGTSYNPSQKYTANAGLTLYAQWNANPYAITYDANGGTGAPGPQTKYHGTNLTLSSTKPTRANYTFLGWATSKDGSVAYRPGDTYSANAPVTLYAVWKPFEYAVTYNGNGGTGEPGQQIKYYGTDLTLSAIRPTRAGYTFLGWAASAAGSVEYQPGGTYSDNTPITLYAVWKAFYTYSLETVRVNASGGVTEDPTGEWIFIKANITTEDHTDNPISAYHFTDTGTTATVGWYKNSDKTGSVTFPYQPASNSFILYAWYHADTEKHELSARFDTSHTTGTVISVIVPPIFRTMDFLAGGKGVAIGKRATKEGMEIAMPVSIEDKPLTISNATINQVNTTIDLKEANNGITAAKYYAHVYRDKNNKEQGRFGFGTFPDGRTRTEMTVRNYDADGNQVANKGFSINMDKSGNITYSVTTPSAFRKAIDCEISDATIALYDALAGGTSWRE